MDPSARRHLGSCAAWGSHEIEEYWGTASNWLRISWRKWSFWWLWWFWCFPDVSHMFCICFPYIFLNFVHQFPKTPGSRLIFPCLPGPQKTKQKTGARSLAERVSSSSARPKFKLGWFFIQDGPLEEISGNHFWLVVTGCHFLFIVPEILGICPHPNWRTHIFQKGWPNHQPALFFKEMPLKITKIDGEIALKISFWFLDVLDVPLDFPLQQVDF